MVVTDSTTFADVVERVFREYLHRADEVPLTGRIVNDIDDSATSLTLNTAHLPPDHPHLIAPNTVLELDYELVLVRSYDPETGDVTCDRGFQGSPRESHAASDTWVRFGTDTTRLRVLQALYDTVDMLWGKGLGFLQACTVTTDAHGVGELPDDAEVVVNVESESTTLGVDFGFSRSPNISTTERGVVTDLANCDLWVEYLSIPNHPEGVTETSRNEFLVDFHVDPRWQRILMVGVLADLSVTRDLSAKNLQALSEIVEQQGFPVGSGTSIHRTLLTWMERVLIPAAVSLNDASSTTRISYQATL